MKPASTLAALLFALVALVHALRLAFQWEISIGNVTLPMWLSVVGVVIPGALAFWLSRDGRVEEANERLVRRVIDEIWTGGKLDLVDELYAEDFYGHIEPTDDWHGRDGVREWAERTRTMLRGFEERVEGIFCQGDWAAVRTRLSGTGSGHDPSTGESGERHVSSAGVLIYRIADGRIAEQWEIANLAGILSQLGATEAESRASGGERETRGEA